MASEKPSRWWQKNRDRSEDRALTVAGLPGLMLQRTTAGVPVSPRGAMSIADAYACIRALSDAAASLPLHAYRETDGGRERIDGGVGELLRRPAPAVTPSAFIGQAVAHLNLWGECFIGLYRDQGGQVFQLGILAPDRVTVDMRGGLPFYGYSDEDGRYGVYGIGDVVHVKGMSVDGLRGISPVKQARDALGYATALSEHGSNVMANGARMEGVLTIPDGPHADEAASNLVEGVEARHKGSENAGKIGVLIGDAKFAAVSMPLHDAEFVAQRELSTREVARIFRVPAWLINGASADSLTYSTVAESMRAFVLTALKPQLVAIEQALTNSEALFPIGSRGFAQFELDGLLRGDPKARAEVYTAALSPQTGWMQRSEVRALEDLPVEDTEPEPPPAPEPPEAESEPIPDRVPEEAPIG